MLLLKYYSAKHSFHSPISSKTKIYEAQASNPSIQYFISLQIRCAGEIAWAAEL